MVHLAGCHCLDLVVAEPRARLSDAIDGGARMLPPLETDTWPSCRPLVEWAVRLLPGGGTFDGPHLWSDDETDRLAEDFLASPEGARHRARARRDMLDALLWYGTGYGKCDPLRWSPEQVEIVLTDWVPRKIVAPDRERRLVPDILRDLVRYGHRRLGIRAGLTEQTVDAVDAFEPAYLALIRSPRAQGVDAIVQAMRSAGAFDVADSAGDLDDEWGGEDWDVGQDLDALHAEAGRIMLDTLAREVGGADVLRSLDDRPLPDEPLDSAGVPDDLAERVGEVARLCDGWWSTLGLDDPGVVELRTATRRLLALVAADGPEGLRRRAKTTGTAAALCWAVASAKRAVRRRSGLAPGVGPVGPLRRVGLAVDAGEDAAARRRHRAVAVLQPGPPADRAADVGMSPVDHRNPGPLAVGAVTGGGSGR